MVHDFCGGYWGGLRKTPPKPPWNKYYVFIIKFPYGEYGDDFQGVWGKKSGSIIKG